MASPLPSATTSDGECSQRYGEALFSFLTVENEGTRVSEQNELVSSGGDGTL